MADEHHAFRAAANVFVVRDNQLLLGKRKNVFGAGTWALPGGHLEFGETMTAAAVRELLEETGLVSKSMEFSNLVNDLSGEQHYIQVGFVAIGVDGEPELKEPDRCEEWRWFPLMALPPDLFPPLVNQIKNFLDHKLFADR